MEPFDSESLSSDSSSSPIVQTQKKVHTRKMRRTDDLISLNVSEDCLENSKPRGKIKQDYISFLPKINLTESAKTPVMINPQKGTKIGQNLDKKIAVFKIGRSMIEGKQFQSNKKPTWNQSKFPKIKLKLTKSQQKKGKENSLKPNKSDSSTTIFSERTVKGQDTMKSKLKNSLRKSKSLSRKSVQEKSKKTPLVPCNELYVNLVPLEKTNLLNAQQLRQLNNNMYYSVRSSPSYRRKTSHYKRSSLSLESIVPCKVILEQLPLEQIRLLTSNEKNNHSLDLSTENKSTANEVDVDIRNTSFELNTSLLPKSTRKVRKSKLPQSSETALIGIGESFFNPPGTSSPLNPAINLNESKFVNSNNSKLDSLLENRNATFEAEASPVTRRSSLNRKEKSTDSNSCNTSTRKSNDQDATYEFDNCNTEISKQTLRSSDKNATFDISPQLTSVPIETENNQESISSDLEISAQKKRKGSGSSDATDQSLHLSSLFTRKSPRKRRSTITLEDSVNDISLLKSVCDSSGTPQALNKSQKAKRPTLINQVLKKKSMSKELDFSNITLRRHSYSDNSRNEVSKLKITNIESTSPPWIDKTNPVADTFEIDKTDDCMVLNSSGKETIEDDGNDTSEDTMDEPNTSSTSSSDDETAEDNQSNLIKRKIGLSGVIEISDDETETDSSSATSDNETYIPRKGNRVTFELNAEKNSKYKLPRKVSVVRLSTPKSMLKSSASNVAVIKNRRVTFNNMSVIIIDDNKEYGSSRKTSNIDLVPTNFPSDDDATNHSPPINKKDRIGHTPMSQHHESSKFEDKRTPALSSNSKQGIDKVVNADSPHFNNRGRVGHTPLRLKPVVENNETTKLNNRLSLRERLRLQNDLVASQVVSKSPKKTKMPNFASIHKKMNEKMLNIQEYSKQKKERAQLLLSGHKPVQAGSSVQKSVTKRDRNSHNKTPRKQLNYEQPSTSELVQNKLKMRKKDTLVSSTPKAKKNENNGFTRFGFKTDRSVTKKDQIMAVANKTKIAKSTTAKNRTDIKGVRSNRRFDLLMKMRDKQQN